MWCARRDSNLRRLAGVSEAGARSRNPEPGFWRRIREAMVRPSWQRLGGLGLPSMAHGRAIPNNQFL